MVKVILRDWIFPIKGLEYVWTRTPVLLLLPLPFFWLVAIHPIGVLYPLLLYWACSFAFQDLGKEKGV